MTDRTMRIAIIICSVGRSDCILDLIPALRCQSRPADRILFVVTGPDDISGDPAALIGDQSQTEIVYSKKGLPRQRNAGLDAVAGDCDVVVFFDDDFIPSRHAIRGIERAFAEFGDVNGMTGDVIADGINGAGFDAEEAMRMVADWDDAHAPDRPLRVIRDGLEGLYGCNMAYRMQAVGRERFDEKLPLYGWQEDIDFAARIPGGRIKTDAFAGVHRGAKSGRETAGRRLGYSQIVNPWYLWRKGTMSGRFAARLAVRNFLANHAKALRPEPWIDRAARASGNWLALGDIMAGRADPGRILTL